MKRPRCYFVYILSNKSRTLYVGVTGNLPQRLHQHRQKLIEGFTRKYNVTQLVYAEETDNVLDALAREKQIKGWSRAKKLALVESVNPSWLDLAEEFCSSDGE